jgi:peptide/nickel transport system substrate-binding protein
MRDLRWQLLIALGGVLLVIGLLLNQTPPPQSSSPQPVSGGLHVEALIGSPLRLNPILDLANQVDEDVDRLLYRGLARFDSSGTPIPDLAERWAISADSKFITVTLRDDATWHDGEPVEAADVVYTFSKLKEEGYPGPADLNRFWSEINIVLLDSRTVQFQLPEPYAPFLDFLAVGLLPDHLLRGVAAADLPDHPFNLEPVGTGPFQFEGFILESGEIVGVSLVANEDFYGQRPYLDRVEFRYFDNENLALQSYRRGEVDALGTTSLEVLPSLLQEPNLNLHSARLPELTLVYFNLDHPERGFLQEKELRQSLAQGMNPQAMVDQILDGQAVVASGPILPATWAFPEGLEPISFNPIEASGKLDALGWELPAGAFQGSEEFVRSKEGRELAFELLHPDRSPYIELAQLIQEYWSMLGVRVELRAVGADEVMEALMSRDYEAALTNIILSRWPDPDPYPLWHDSQAETGQNFAVYDDRNSGIWLERARTTIDRGRRAELYASFQFRFQDQLPAIPLFHPIYNYAITAEMQGVRVGPFFDPSDRFSLIEGWFLLARRSPDPTQPPAQ